MSIQMSTALRSRLIGPEGFLDIMPTCEIRVFTGGQPGSADAAQQGVRLGTVTVNGSGIPLTLLRSGYLLLKPALAVWLLHTQADGLAGWFRVCLPDDNGTSSTTAPRVDGTITQADAEITGQMVWKNTTVVANTYKPIDFFLFGLPPIGASA